MSYVEFKNVTKVFGDFTACSDVSVSIQRSTVHCIVGENGAGKSTLVKMLGGLEPVTAGQLLLNGLPYSPSSAQDAFKNKIAFIHQHFVLASQLSAIDNLVLSASSGQSSLRTQRKSEVLKGARALLQKFSWNIPLHKNVEDLSVGEQQRLEILKALMQNPDIIIFDEPTAVLTPQESEELLKFILQLKNEGKTVILISHKLNEIKTVADFVTVLRQGKHIATRPGQQLTIEEIAELMIGRRIVRKDSRKLPDNKKVLMKVPGTETSLLNSEIFGVAGIEGNGQDELIAQLLEEFKRHSLKYGDITEDRIRLSVFPEMDLCDHMLLKHGRPFTRNRLVDQKALHDATEKLVKEWDVRPPFPKKALSEFSGGNQQKFVVGREMWNTPDVLLAAHPTRGVDLGAQEKIHNALLSYSESGRTVVLFSSDLDELLYLSDRFVIINKGHIFGPFQKGQLSEKEIGIHMAGPV